MKLDGIRVEVLSLEVEETFMISERGASRHRRKKEGIKRLSILVSSSFHDRARLRNITISALNLGKSVIILFKCRIMFPEVTACYLHMSAKGTYFSCNNEKYIAGLVISRFGTVVFDLDFLLSVMF
jgi:hypothetical protein